MPLQVLIALFRRDICLLSAGLDYPPSVPAQSSRDHPADKFADAFLTAQSVIARRSRLNETWKLRGFWGDRIIQPMTTIGKVLDPIIENALKKKGEKEVGAAGDNTEGGTLLSHLVNLTDGKPCSLFPPRSPASYTSRDPKIIRDETLNIMIAGRDTVRSTLPVGCITDDVTFS
jgi:hypothetical protein